MGKADDAILSAALTVFSRFGYAKTTMTDIAREAQVARATVYNTYAGKPDVLRAVVLHVARSLQEDVRQGWETCTTVEDRLDVFLHRLPLAMYDRIQSTPQMSELVDEMHSIAVNELSETRREWVAFLTKMLQQSAPDKPAPDVAALADFLYATAINAKYGSDNRAQVVSRLALLKDAMVRLMQ